MKIIKIAALTLVLLLVVTVTHTISYNKGHKNGVNSCKEMSRLMQELVDIHERIEDREMLDDWEY